MLLKEEVKDFDVYFLDRESALKVAQYYVKKFNDKTKAGVEIKEEGERIKLYIPSCGVASEDNKLPEDTEDVLEELESEEKVSVCGDKFRPIFISSNAITLSDKVQVVIRFFGSPEKIHDTYDFIHCTCYYTWISGVVLPERALESILTRQLYYAGSKYPLCSVMRMRKFISNGWHINAGQILKMLYQVSCLDLNDINVLEDQLVGVDTTYFYNLVTRLREWQESGKSSGGGVQGYNTYLFDLIDHVF